MNGSGVLASLAVLLAVLFASLAAALDAAQQLEAASSSGSSAVRPCDQVELVELGSILKNNTRKRQCQVALGITEMLKPDGLDFKVLCDEAACTAALNILYNILPQCAYQDWAPQEQAGKVLKYCGITPTNTTTTDDGAASSLNGGSATVTGTWGSTSGSSTDFAPIGATTSPSTTAPTPAPTSVAATTPLTSVLVVATSLLATAAFA
uniref:Elicitin-like protein n=1 Tax=Globisporangium ultimum (strain ATCC 200006 / CBS 805.95 / DAOM BR144) TaxID=431595 RepID=K3WPU7_GLOUD